MPRFHERAVEAGESGDIVRDFAVEHWPIRTR